MKRKILETVDYGSHVFCDFCCTEHTAEVSTLGGAMHGSYALCSNCTAKVPPSQLRDPALEGETFHAYVMRIRRGNNTMTISGFE